MFEVADWSVVAGTTSIAHSSLGKHHRALRIHYHPQFNRQNNDYDVGLLRTITDMDMTGKKEMASSCDRIENLSNSKTFLTKNKTKICHI